MLSIPAPTPVGPPSGGGAVPRPVVARGGRVERWGPCGCQAPRHAARCTLAPQLSGKEGLCPCTPKSVGERGLYGRSLGDCVARLRSRHANYQLPKITV